MHFHIIFVGFNCLLKISYLLKYAASPSFSLLNLLTAAALSTALSSPTFAAEATNSATNPIATSNINARDIQALDQAFKNLSSAIYQHYNKKPKAKKIDNIQELQKNVKALEAKQDSFNAILLIKANKNTIENAIDEPAALYFISTLLKHNEWKTANTLYQQIKDYGDNFSTTNASFRFTRYFFAKRQWQQALQSFNGSFEDLAIEDNHYALLIHGISLQKLKIHRKAVKYYQRIPATSKLYAHAQLNTAIAYIRQGWWSDARLIINALVTANAKPASTPAPATPSDDMINRSHLVLGYALFQQEYYRDSREVFRNITLDSPYTNQALLGIGLTSSSQEDYIGALNAFSLLKNKTTKDLAVDEAYLLQPYIYEKMNQGVTASGLYSEAIEYYQTRITNLKAKAALKNIGKQQVILQNNGITFTEQFPNYFLSNLSETNYLTTMVNEPHLKQQAIALQKRYQDMHQRMIQHLFENRLSHLNSYLNQSRYGLARLYDNSLLKKQ